VKKQTVVSVMALLFGQMFTSGCGDSGTGGCGDCEYFDPDRCEIVDPTEGFGDPCEEDVDECDGDCPASCASPGGGLQCAGGTPSGCTWWDPDSNITYYMGTYTVNLGWAQNVLADVSPIWYCDGVTVSFTGTGIQIAGAHSGDAVYELGLRTGDKLQYINGYPLFSVADAAWAVVALWVLEGETTYELDVLRSMTSLEFDYVLLASEP